MTRHRVNASWLKRNRTGLATFVVMITGAGLLITYAAIADGNLPHHASLNDDGVWTSTDKSHYGSAVAEISVQAKKYSQAIFPPSASSRVDVLQTGSAVVAWDQDSGTVDAHRPDHRCAAG